MERAAAHERAHKLPVFIHAHDEQPSFEIVAFRYGDFGSEARRCHIRTTVLGGRCGCVCTGHKHIS